MEEKTILGKVEKYLEQKDPFFKKESLSEEEFLAQYLLPSLENSKDILDGLYSSNNVKERRGLFGKIKTKIERKIVNIVINVIERQSAKQQKFNELTFRAIELLVQKKKK